jgi:replicative DNA helicase
VYDQSLELTIAQILFHNPDLVDTDLIEADDFCTDIKDAVSRIIRLRKNGNLLNETTVGRRLEIPDEDEVKHFEEFVKALKSLNRERKLQSLGKKITEISVQSTPIDEKLMKIKKMVEGFDQSTSNINDFLLANSIETYKEKLFGDSDETDIVSTGIREIDLRCGRGFRPGELITVAGEPGGFKSTLIYNIAMNVALQGKPVMIFTYEVSKDEINEIFLSMLANIDSIKLRTKSFGASDIPKMQKILKKLEELPIYIIDTNATLADIRLMAFQKKPAMILVDYIQIMPDIGVDPIRSLEYVSRQFKLMSNPQILNCPIVMISQFSRQHGHDGQIGERKMSDLKGSSCLAYDSLIHMADGTFMQIGDMVKNNIKSAKVLTIDEGKVVEGNMVNAFSSGIRKVYNLTLNSGRQIKATGEHRFMSVDGWRELKDFSVNDRMAVPRVLPEEFNHLVNDIFWDYVKSIEYIGEEETFDITVDKTSSFIVNGIWSHNSLEQNSAIIMFTKHLQTNTRKGKDDILEISIVKNRHGIKGDMKLPIIPMYHKIDAEYCSKD